MGPQLPLSVQLADATSFDNFHPGPNAAALSAVAALAHGESSTSLLLQGPTGSGKTHLLQASVRAAGTRGLVAYLPLEALRPLSAALLDGLDQSVLIAIDSIELAFMERGFALALLRLLDVLRVRGAACVIASQTPLEELSAHLPDLRTRLEACARFTLKSLDDLELQLLLIGRAHFRGLEMPPEVADFLTRRLPRSIPTLIRSLDELDCAALSAQRRLTIPFVQKALATQLRAPAPPAERIAPG